MDDELLHRTMQRALRTHVDPRATLAWSAGEGRWQAGIPLGTGGPLVTLPLPVTDPDAASDALLATLDVLAADGPRRLERRADAAGEVAFLHDEASGRWLVWLACEDCGGCFLDTGITDPAMRPLVRWQAKRCRSAAAEGAPCPRCTTIAVRARERAAAPPVAWFDTIAGAWLLWLPADGEVDEARELDLPRTWFVAAADVNAAVDRALTATAASD
jgi:hypothetical protein